MKHIERVLLGLSLFFILAFVTLGLVSIGCLLGHLVDWWPFSAPTIILLIASYFVGIELQKRNHL
jgi:hypothetical protein